MCGFWPIWAWYSTKPNVRNVSRGSFYPIPRVAEPLGALGLAANGPEADYFGNICISETASKYCQIWGFWPFWAWYSTKPNDRIVSKGSIYPISKVAEPLGALGLAGNAPEFDFLKNNFGSRKRPRFTANGLRQGDFTVQKTLFSIGISQKLEGMEVLWNFLGPSGQAGPPRPRPAGHVSSRSANFQTASIPWAKNIETTTR